MKVTVLGSGSWGTALSCVLINNGHNVTLWSFKKEEAEQIQKDGENKEFLPGIKLASSLKITNDKEEAVKDADILVFVVPSKFVRGTLEGFKGIIKEDAVIVNASKGLEERSLKRISEVISEIYPQSKVAVLSGPSHAEEVGRGIPTTLVAASADLKTAQLVQDVFMNSAFRVYTNTDITGVELGGALKNVIALAAGVSDGMGYGDNTKAALMTRGMKEISQLGQAMGGEAETFSGLSGMGDLIVTCTSMHSRNRRAGILMGQGKSLQETLDEVHMVVEGVNTAKAAYDLSVKYNVNMPIVAEIYNVLEKGKDPKRAVYDLMTRDKKDEHVAEADMGGKSVWN